MRPKVIILDEPTRGIDVGAKAEIYEIMRALADSGVAILMISSDMEEVIGVSDRIAVMHEGRVSGFLEREDFSEHNVLMLAVGQRDTRGRRRSCLRRNSGLLLLILVIGGVSAFINPQFISQVNLLNTLQSDRPVRAVCARRRVRHHHRRHRPSIGSMLACSA